MCVCHLTSTLCKLNCIFLISFLTQVNVFQGCQVGGEVLHLSDDRWHTLTVCTCHCFWFQCVNKLMQYCFRSKMFAFCFYVGAYCWKEYITEYSCMCAFGDSQVSRICMANKMSMHFYIKFDLLFCKCIKMIINIII